MTRPTPATIDRMLQVAEREAHPTSCAGVLAAEVLALRADMAEVPNMPVLLALKAERDGLRDDLHAARNQLSTYENQLRKLREELAEARADVTAAAGELLVEMPSPGTPMSRVMIANALMRGERDESRATLARVEALSAKWQHAYAHGEAYSDELEAALRGEP